MSNYYYLAAQLPSLQFGMPSPVSYKDFLELASRFLTDTDISLLKTLTLEPCQTGCHTGSSVFDSWNDYERSLRLAMARLRAIKMKKDSANYKTEDTEDPAIAQIARQAISFDSPLEAEQFLDSERWKFIDSVKGLHMFDRDAIFAYGLQLQMMERKAVFNESEGFASYRSIYNRILDISGEDND